MILLWVGTYFFQGYIYTEPSSQIALAGADHRAVDHGGVLDMVLFHSAERRRDSAQYPDRCSISLQRQ